MVRGRGFPPPIGLRRPEPATWKRPRDFRQMSQFRPILPARQDPRPLLRFQEVSCAPWPRSPVPHKLALPSMITCRALQHSPSAGPYPARTGAGCGSRPPLQLPAASSNYHVAGRWEVRSASAPRVCQADPTCWPGPAPRSALTLTWVSGGEAMERRRDRAYQHLLSWTRRPVLPGPIDRLPAIIGGGRTCRPRAPATGASRFSHPRALPSMPGWSEAQPR